MGVVTLTVVENEPEADVICGLLRSSGIKCFHRNRDMTSSVYPIGAASPTEVVVDEADLARAQQVLDAR
jgi:hypothetical protein